MATKIPVDAIIRLNAEGHSAVDIVNALYRESRVRMSRYDVQSIVENVERQRAAMKTLPPPPPLMDFIPQASPKFHRPTHLRPFVELFEQIGKRPMRVVGHAPPRHSKTETILHAIAHVVRKDPTLLCGYSTYAMDLTYSKSVRARTLAQESGVKLARAAAKEWRTLEGGGLLATSTGGPLTGHGISGAMFIDDAFKNRVQAESKTIRQTIWDWFSDVVMTRLEPGASVFILMTRWHQDDLGGRALREMGKHKRTPEGQRLCELDCPGCGPNPIDGFEEIRLPAIDELGRALWPERWPLPALEARRREVTSYTWFSLYQGVPRARGSAVFSGVAFYNPADMPAGGFRITIGVDLSYTESTSADWAVAVVLMRWGTSHWVLDVLRDQTTAPKFALKLKALRKRWKGATMYSIYYGPEKGSIDFMRTLGVPIVGLKRPGDKFARSQATAAKWNDGKILVPQTALIEQHGRDCPGAGCTGCGVGLVDTNHREPRTCEPDCTGCRYAWLDPFLEVVSAFTGVKDDIDDDVDALVAAYEGQGQSPAALAELAQTLGQAEAPNIEDAGGMPGNIDPWAI